MKKEVVKSVSSIEETEKEKHYRREMLDYYLGPNRPKSNTPKYDDSPGEAAGRDF